MINRLVNMNRRPRIAMLLFGFILSVIFMPFVGNFWFIFFILAFTFLGLLIYTNGIYDRSRGQLLEKSLDKALINLGIHADDSYLSDDYLSGIALDQDKETLIILVRQNINSNFNSVTFDFKDIMECSIIEDEETITKSSKSLAIGGALVAGGTGAVVGGLLGDKHSNEKVLKATLSIVVDDIMNPVHEINFLNSNILVDRNSELYQTVYKDIYKWYKRIGVILKRNGKLNI